MKNESPDKANDQDSEQDLKKFNSTQYSKNIDKFSRISKISLYDNNDFNQNKNELFYDKKLSLDSNSPDVNQ